MVQSRTSKNERQNLKNGGKRMDLMYFEMTALDDPLHPFNRYLMGAYKKAGEGLWTRG